MANAVAARIHGDDYQALVFWQQACRLLRGEDEIEALLGGSGYDVGFRQLAVPVIHQLHDVGLVAELYSAKWFQL